MVAYTVTIDPCFRGLMAVNIFELTEVDCTDEERAEVVACLEAAPDLLSSLDRLQANPNDPACHRMALDAIRKARGQA